MKCRRSQTSFQLSTTRARLYYNSNPESTNWVWVPRVNSSSVHSEWRCSFAFITDNEMRALPTIRLSIGIITRIVEWSWIIIHMVKDNDRPRLVELKSIWLSMEIVRELFPYHYYLVVLFPWILVKYSRTARGGAEGRETHAEQRQDLIDISTFLVSYEMGGNIRNIE